MSVHGDIFIHLTFIGDNSAPLTKNMSEAIALLFKLVELFSSNWSNCGENYTWRKSLMSFEEMGMNCRETESTLCKWFLCIKKNRGQMVEERLCAARCTCSG